MRNKGPSADLISLSSLISHKGLLMDLLDLARSALQEYDSAAQPIAATHAYWTVQAPGCFPIEMLFSPSVSLKEVIALYPDARIEPIAEGVWKASIESSDALASASTHAKEAREAKKGAADDRRPCAHCANLSPTGICLAAAQGKLPGIFNRMYRPAPDQPKRCEGYIPTAADPDQRPGKERWSWF
jgi:hypothetical protein